MLPMLRTKRQVKNFTVQEGCGHVFNTKILNFIRKMFTTVSIKIIHTGETKGLFHIVKTRNFNISLITATYLTFLYLKKIETQLYCSYLIISRIIFKLHTKMTTVLTTTNYNLLCWVNCLLQSVVLANLE